MTKKIFRTNLLSLFFFFHFTAEFAVAGHIVYDKVFAYSAIYEGPEVSIFCPHVVAVNKSILCEFNCELTYFIRVSGWFHDKPFSPIDGAVCKYLVLDYMALRKTKQKSRV